MLRNPLAYTGSNSLALGAGTVWVIPQGRFYVNSGKYSSLEEYDPVSTTWLPMVGAVADDINYVNSDGQNFRIANHTGCPVAAIVSNGGSGYTSAPTVTASEGSSKWTAIIGQTVSSITIVNHGTGYVYPPLVTVQTPPPPGLPANAVATIANGTISAITMINVGGGYLLPPAVSITNDPRDNAGNGGYAIPVLANQGKVTGVICTDPSGGVGITSGTVPTLAFSGGGGSAAAATAIMCWTVASVTVGAGGGGYAGTVVVTTLGNGIPTVSAAFTNPRFQGGIGMLRLRPAALPYSVSAGGVSALLTGGDTGLIGGVATNVTLAVQSAAVPSTVATLTLVPGGSNDVVFVMAA